MKIKNNKGFTLTELVVVIVILALLAIIAIPAYNSIRSNILEKQYDNLVTLVETKAKEYASANGLNLTNVQELIEAGLIETDDGNILYDPRDKTEMNCFLIEIDYKNGTYHSKLTDVKNCNIEEAKKEFADISVIITGMVTGNSYENKYGSDDNLWVSENLKLSVDLGGIVEDDVLSYRWVSRTGKHSEDNILYMETTSVIDTEVSLEVTTKDNYKHFGYAKVEIDKEPPKITNVVVNGGDNWNTKRQVVVEATDQYGSGMKGYYVGHESCGSLKDIDYEESNKFVFPSEDDKLEPNKTYNYNR